MSKVLPRVLKLIKKTTIIVLYSILAIFVLVNLFILLSGRTYIYKGVMSTYLVGVAGPTIYDLDKFPYRTLEKSTKTSVFDSNKKEISSPEGFEKFQKKNQTTAFIVFKGNEILFEKYYDKHTKSTVSNSFSAAKTMVALLIGIAIEDGDINSLDDSVGDYIPEFSAGDKSKITIRNLLNMASGLDWTESGENPLSNNAESYYGSDLYGLVTRQHVISKPGREFIYQSGNSQLLGFIIKNATGKNVSDYCTEKFWSKMGAEYDAYWSLDKEDGNEKAFCCLYATARDFGRIGQVIMHRGKWNNHQIVPEWYMNEMFLLPKDILTEEGIENHQYGLHIWLFDGYKHPVQYCRGIKGQYIISIPDEDVVIVRLGSHRLDNFDIPKKEKEIKKQLLNIGHPKDLPAYINFAEKIIKQSRK